VSLLSSALLAIAMRFGFPRYVPNSRELNRMAPSTGWRESISRIRANRVSLESKKAGRAGPRSNELSFEP
jgi:hypothetical protein